MVAYYNIIFVIISILFISYFLYPLFLFLLYFMFLFTLKNTFFLSFFALKTLDNKASKFSCNESRFWAFLYHKNEKLL